jgi:hypothetical protein
VSSSNLIRWGALAIMVAGALSILLGALSIPSFVEESSEGTGWYLLELTRWAVLVVGLVGLYLYLRHSRRFGGLGTVGFYMLIIVSLANVIIYLIFALTKGAGAQWFDARFGLIQALLTIFGTLLSGMGILRARSLPRAGAWLWILAVLVYVGIIFSFIVGANDAFANWGFLVVDGLFGLGCIVLGHGLWSHRGEPVQPARVS